MYFFKKKGKQTLDLQGNLILSHNSKLVKARYPGHGPKTAANAFYIANIPKLTRRQKVRASIVALRFIWAKHSTAFVGEANA